jgi:hypothetical protein
MPFVCVPVGTPHLTCEVARAVSAPLGELARVSSLHHQAIRSASDPPSSLLPLVNPGVPPSAWALPDRCRARTPAGEVYGEGMKARVATVVGFVARLRCVWSWRLAPVAWRFGPTHACQGMGCRYCGACVPADGWGSCGRALGRGIRPALNPLLNARLSETATRGRAPFAPPRADEDPSWRYGHLQETRRTLT